MSCQRRSPMVVAYKELPPLMTGPGGWTESRWCGACRPKVGQHDTLRLAPLYRTGDLSGECETCGIKLKDLA